MFKKEKTILSSIIAGFAVCAYLAAWTMYSSPREEPDFEAKKVADMRECESFGKHKGFSTRRVGDSVLEMTVDGFDDPKFTFAMSEAIILACDNIDVKNYCMGIATECGIDGTKIVFSYEKPKVF
jgi:hypothetical protein